MRNFWDSSNSNAAVNICRGGSNILTKRGCHFRIILAEAKMEGKKKETHTDIIYIFDL